MLRSIILFLLLLNFAFAGGPRTQTTTSVTTSSSLVLLRQTGTIYLLIVNKGSQTVYVKFGSNVGVGEGIPIPAGGSYEPINPPDDAVYMKSASGTQSIELLRG